MLATITKLTLIVLSVIILSFSYFYFFGEQSITRENFFIYLNKTIANSGVMCIIMSLTLSTSRKIGVKLKQSFNFFIKHLGLTGFYIASVHILLSLLLINSKNHPYLFDVDLQLNLGGQMTVLFGAISFGIFLMPAITSISVIRNGMSKEKWQSVQSLSYLGIGVVSFHLLFISFARFIYASDNSINFNYEPLVVSLIILMLLFVRIIAIFIQKSKK